MIVGVPTEIKTHEYRVALTPATAREVVEHGHDVLLQSGAGEGSGHADADYTECDYCHGTVQGSYLASGGGANHAEPVTVS